MIKKIPTLQQAMQALAQVKDPELHRNLVDLNMIRDLQISPQGKIVFTLVLTIPSCPLKNKMAAECKQVLNALPGVTDVEIIFGAMTPEERKTALGTAVPALPKLSQFNRVDRLIAVMSGKGGVGKTSVTALLAVGLARRGLKVGIMDADVTGPSIPKVFGLSPGGLRGAEQGILPAITPAGIKIISTNLLVQAEDTPVIWRGPVISSAIQQFWTDVLWGKLDYLLVDMPPGTSDAALTVLQSLPLTGVVLVTTPQDLAALVVRKAVSMLTQLNVPILGVVENMSYFTCPGCGAQHDIFGPSHLSEIEGAIGHKLLAVRIPIDPAFSHLSDHGQVEDIDTGILEAFLDELTCQP